MMMGFSPADWISIGTSLIGAYFACRFIFLACCMVLGSDPSVHRLMVSAVVTHVEAPLDDGPP